MNNNRKQAYIDKMSAQLNEWSAKLELSMRADSAEKEAQFKKKLEDLRTAGSEKFESMKTSVHDAWLELTKPMNQRNLN